MTAGAWLISLLVGIPSAYIHDERASQKRYDARVKEPGAWPAKLRYMTF